MSQDLTLIKLSPPGDEPHAGAERGIDAARSLREGKLVVNEAEPMTIADGARTISLGKRNWEIIKNSVDGVCKEIKAEASALDVASVGAACNISLNEQGLVSGLMAALPGMGSADSTPPRTVKVDAQRMLPA